MFSLLIESKLHTSQIIFFKVTAYPISTALLQAGDADATGEAVQLPPLPPLAKK